MTLFLGKLDKNGEEFWDVYHGKDGMQVWPPKSTKDGQSKSAAKKEWLEKEEKFLTVTHESRYKVAIDGIELMFKEEQLAALPAAGSTVLLEVNKFFSPASKRDYYSLVGIGDAEMAAAQLSVLVRRQEAAARVALEQAIVGSG